MASAPDDVVELGAGHALLVVVVAEEDDVGHAVALDAVYDVRHGGVGRTRVDVVAGEDHQVGTLGADHGVDALQGGGRAWVVALVVEVGKLDYLELATGVKLQGLGGGIGAGGEGKERGGSKLHDTF